MMYICQDCGHIFEDGEEMRYKETHGFTDGSYEEFTGCPICGGNYEKAEICESCGVAFSTENPNFYYMWCKDCLVGNVNYSLFRKFLEEDAISKSSDITAIEYFFVGYVWNMPFNCLRVSSYEMKDDLFYLYDQKVEAEQPFKMFRNIQTPLLDNIRRFISDDPGEYAYWLNKKEGEKNG